MSQETSEWLNRNILVGFTDKRGQAWHYQASDQGDEPNHYPGPIPADDVRRRLFSWNARSVPVLMPANHAGGSPIAISGHRAIVRDDTQDVLGVVSDRYAIHPYSESLLDTTADVIGDLAGIGSAGLLKRGALAFVQVEVPENVATDAGVTFRPNLLAATSLDGSLATTWRRTVTVVVCDNTLAAAMSENGVAEYKVKHSRLSGFRVHDARQALSLLDETATQFASEVDRLTRWSVTTRAWSNLLDAVIPVPEGPGRGLTLATAKRDTIETLYASDMRVSPWKGTAFGVVQAFNTYAHHYAHVRGAERVERNISNAIMGTTEQNDRNILAELEKISPELVAA